MSGGSMRLRMNRPHNIIITLRDNTVIRGRVVTDNAERVVRVFRNCADVSEVHCAELGEAMPESVQDQAFAIADESARADIEMLCVQRGVVQMSDLDIPLWDPVLPTSDEYDHCIVERALRYLGARNRIRWHGQFVQVHSPWSDA